MTGSNPLLDLRLIAKDLIDRIGRDKAYSYENDRHVDAPAFKHLDEEALIGELVDIVSQKYGKDGEIEVVFIEDPEIGQRSINGMYAYHPEHNSIYIVVNAEMNYCWKKFTKIKELCHVYIDFNNELSQHVKTTQEHNYRISLEKVFEETMKFKDFDFSSLDDMYDMGEEMFMVLLATELMIPIYDREEVMDMVSQSGSKGLTINKIAQSLLMPEFILQKYIDMKAINAEPKYTDIRTA